MAVFAFIAMMSPIIPFWVAGNRTNEVKQILIGQTVLVVEAFDFLKVFHDAFAKELSRRLQILCVFFAEIGQGVNLGCIVNLYADLAKFLPKPFFYFCMFDPVAAWSRAFVAWIANLGFFRSRALLHVAVHRGIALPTPEQVTKEKGVATGTGPSTFAV